MHFINTIAAILLLWAIFCVLDGLRKEVPEEEKFEFDEKDLY